MSGSRLAARRAPKVPEVRDLLKACEDEGQAKFFDAGPRSILTIGIVWGVGTLIAVQSAFLGDDELPMLQEVRDCRGIGLLVTQDERVFLRTRSGHDIPVAPEETILDTYYRMSLPGEKLAGWRIPGTSIDIQHHDGQIAVGSAGKGVVGAVQVPKREEIVSVGTQILNQFLGKR